MNSGLDYTGMQEFLMSVHTTVSPLAFYQLTYNVPRFCCWLMFSLIAEQPSTNYVSTRDNQTVVVMGLQYQSVFQSCNLIGWVRVY